MRQRHHGVERSRDGRVNLFFVFDDEPKLLDKIRRLSKALVARTLTIAHELLQIDLTTLKQLVLNI